MGATRRVSSMPWFRMNADYARDAKLRKAKAVAVWPAIIARMKSGYGFVSDDDIDADLLAEELFIPASVCAAAVDGLKRVGLLVWGEADVEVGGRSNTVRHLTGWTTPHWTEYQPDSRPRSDKRTQHAAHGGPATDHHEVNRPRDGSHGDTVPRDRMPRDMTGHDGTVQDKETCRSPSAGAHTHTANDATGSLADLEQMVLDCLKPEKRRGATFLSAMEVRKLTSLVEQYGRDALVDALGECGGADMPLAKASYMLTKRAAERASERTEPRSNAPAPLPLYLCTEPDPVRPVISAEARKSLDDLTRELSRGRNS